MKVLNVFVKMVSVLHANIKGINKNFETFKNYSKLKDTVKAFDDFRNKQQKSVK